MSATLWGLRRRWRAIAFITLAGGLFIAWVYIMAGGEIAEMWRIVQHKVNIIARTHPAYLCSAIAILPLAGFPVSALYVLTGIIHGFWLGTALACVGVFVNMVISYWLAARIFRTPLQAILNRRGYSIPRIETAHINRTIVIVRLTPAFPYFVQNYLLGVAHIPFSRYLLLSMLLQFPMAALAIATGGALFEGKLGLALLALSLLVAAGLFYSILRKHLNQQR